MSRGGGGDVPEEEPGRSASLEMEAAIFKYIHDALLYQTRPRCQNNGGYVSAGHRSVRTERFFTLDRRHCAEFWRTSRFCLKDLFWS